MKLKEKTYKKFVDFFEKMALKHGNEEFEIAYSEIQRDTGVASITLKKGIQVLREDGIIQVSPGRNTRYGKFKYLLNNNNNNNKHHSDNNSLKKALISQEESDIDLLIKQQKNMQASIEQLRLRVRTQEMAISAILDRLAVLEDQVGDNY